MTGLIPSITQSVFPGGARPQRKRSSEFADWLGPKPANVGDAAPPALLSLEDELLLARMRENARRAPVTIPASAYAPQIKADEERQYSFAFMKDAPMTGGQLNEKI